MFFTEELWQAWLEKELRNYAEVKDRKTGLVKREYRKKGYLHFDLRFWLPKRSKELRDVLANPNGLDRHRFYPFVRWVVKTPRYKRNDKGRKNKKGEVPKRIISIKERPIAFASHFDALLYSYHAFQLNDIYQRFLAASDFSECVLAYRSDLGLNNIDFAREVFQFIGASGPCTAVALDVKSFFDTLQHTRLKQNWCRVLGVDQLPADQYKIYRSLTKYSYVNRGAALRALGIELRGRKGQKSPPRICEDHELELLRRRNVITTNAKPYGIPQGSPLSALLSNIYMIDFDKRLNDAAKEAGFIYRRYCDDIILVGPTAEVDAMKKLAYEQVDAIGLKIQPAKEEEVVFRPNEKVELRGYNAKLEREKGTTQHRNLQYLGFEFDGTRTYIRSGSLARFYQRMMTKVWGTAKATFGLRSRGDQPFTRLLYRRFSIHGEKNFPRYAYKAASEQYETIQGMREGMSSPQIRKQMSRHVGILQDAIVAKSRRRKAQKERSPSRRKGGEPKA